MNINKKMLIFVSFVAAVTTGIMLFYAGTEENIKEDKEVIVREENVEDEPQPTEPPAAFTVCLEGDTVTLYLVEQDEKTAVESVKIDIGYYPDEDIKALSNGITAYNIEEGFKILENFAN